MVPNSYTARWTGAFDFLCPPSAAGARGETLRIALLDRDTLTPDDPIGAAEIDLGRLFAGRRGAAFGKAELLTLALSPPSAAAEEATAQAQAQAVVGHDGLQTEVEVRVTCLGLAEELAEARPGPGEAGVELRLDMAPEEVGQDPRAFQDEVARDVAKALGVEREAVRAAGLRAGSVIVDLVIDSEAEDEEGRGPLELAQLLQAQCDDPSSPLRASGRTSRACSAAIRKGPLLPADQALASPAAGSLPATAATKKGTSKRRGKLGATVPAPVPALTPEEERALKELSAEEAELLRLSAEEDGLAARNRVRASRKARPIELVVEGSRGALGYSRAWGDAVFHWEDNDQPGPSTAERNRGSVAGVRASSLFSQNWRGSQQLGLASPFPVDARGSQSFYS